MTTSANTGASQIKVCIMMSENGSLWSWMDLKDTYKSLQEFTEAAGQEFLGESVFTAFTLEASDFQEKEVQTLFKLLPVLEKVVSNSDIPDHLPGQLLEAIVDKVLEHVRQAGTA